MRKKQFFLSVCLNPTLQKTIQFKHFQMGEVNRAIAVSLEASGKGVNVTRVLTQLGANAVHLTHNGSGDKDRFLALCKKDRLKVITVTGRSAVRSCTTVLDLSGRSTTEIIEPNFSINQKIEKKLIRKFDHLLSKVHTLILSGTTANGYSKDIFSSLIQKAQKESILVIADFHGKALQTALPFSPDYIKINAKEFAQTFLPELSFNEKENLSPYFDLFSEKAVAIKKQYQSEVIITLGKQGVLFFPNGEMEQIAAHQAAAINTIGCGDAFCAAFAFALHQNPTKIREALNYGSKIAALNAATLKPGSILSGD